MSDAGKNGSAHVIVRGTLRAGRTYTFAEVEQLSRYRHLLEDAADMLDSWANGPRTDTRWPETISVLTRELATEIKRALEAYD